MAEILDALPTLKRDDDLGMDEAFGRDGHLESAMRKLVAGHRILTVVETGSWRGYTTRRFAEFVPRVHTIELDPEMARAARETLLDTANATVHDGSSAHLLPELIPNLSRPVLYYLDAHWYRDWPLFEELESIARLAGECVIVIHDVKVPGKDFGFDSYGGRALTFELVKPYLDKLPFKWRHSFNEEAEGHRRGVLFITPEQCAS